MITIDLDGAIEEYKQWVLDQGHSPKTEYTMLYHAQGFVAWVKDNHKGKGCVN